MNYPIDVYIIITRLSFALSFIVIENFILIWGCHLPTILYFNLFLKTNLKPPSSLIVNYNFAEIKKIQLLRLKSSYAFIRVSKES